MNTNPRSLLKDSNDTAALLLPQGKLKEGESRPVQRFFQHVPHFFTREGAPLSLVGSCRGASAFLIGGGPSFADLDHEPLTHMWTMTLNNGPRSFRPRANCTVDEPSRFSKSIWLDPTIMKFIPMAHFERPLWDNRLLRDVNGGTQRWEKSPLCPGDCPNVIGYRRNEKFHAPRWLYEETVNWGNHANYGGGRSVMLAAMRILFLLGFRRVYLLGVDFNMTSDRPYHFSEDKGDAGVRGNMATYAKLQERFTQLQPYFLKEDFVVKNCNPQSHLTAFPFISYEDALREASEQIGDYVNERTRGMYKGIDDKLKEIDGFQNGESAVNGVELLGK